MSKQRLAEKLGFYIEGNDRIVISGDHRTREHGFVSAAELQLWNLCLELSARLEKFEVAAREIVSKFGVRSGECYTCDLVIDEPDDHAGCCPIPDLEKQLKSERLAEKEKKA